ncbi:MAG: RidA family protein [Gemmatimonadota bacterium]
MHLREFFAAAAILVAIASGTELSAQEARQYINERSAASPGGPPFSGAVMVGNTLYLSGMLGVGSGLALTVEQEAAAVLNNVQDVLEAAGMTMDDLVSVQIFASDLSTYDTFNAVYRDYFLREFPARAFIGTGELLQGARFEVMGVAAKRPAQ